MSLIPTHILDQILDRTCVVACSGGVDSVVLLSTIMDLGINAEIAHVNYHLRGAESNEDEAFVRQLAAGYGIPIHVQRCDLSSKKESPGNIQQLARDARYKFFEEILRSDENKLILLAHHADDQVETFYLNLARGSGLKGLASMPEMKGAIIRPFLRKTKQELIEVARKKGLQWREDSSNTENDYRRNQLRNIILPELCQQVPSLRESVLTIVSVFQEELDRSQKVILPLLERHRQEHFIPFDDLRKLSEKELHLYFDQLGLSKAQMFELLRMKRKGSRIDISNNQFSCSLFRTIGGFEILEAEELTLPEIKVSIVNELPVSFNKNELYLNPEKCSGALQIRHVRTGDRMQIIGLKGSKLLSNIFSDAKAGQSDKQKAVVITDDQDILWFPGYAISPKAIADKATESIWKIELF